MAILTRKLELLFCHTQLKMAETLGDRNAQQHHLEHIVALHIRLQIAREQAYNKQLFSSL